MTEYDPGQSTFEYDEIDAEPVSCTNIVEFGFDRPPLRYTRYPFAPTFVQLTLIAPPPDVSEALTVLTVDGGTTHDPVVMFLLPPDVSFPSVSLSFPYTVYGVSHESPLKVYDPELVQLLHEPAPIL